MTVAVSSGGRLFYVLDNAPTASILLPPQWQLVARDAFNGVLLWKRPIAGWEWHLRPKSAGPPELSRRLVASGDRVYVTLGLNAPVTALDAATGQTLQTYAGTEGTEEVLYREGVLYFAIGSPVEEKDGAADVRSVSATTVMAVEAASGRVLWKRADANPLPMSLAIGGQRLFWLAPDGLVCADVRSGADVWRTQRDVPQTRPSFSAPTLVVQGDVVLCADRRSQRGPDIDESTGKRIPTYLAVASPGDLVAYAIQDGRPLWTAKCAETYCAPIDVLVSDGLVWLGQSRARHAGDYTVGLDPLSGDVKRRISPDKAFETTMGHHRCYRDCATGRYLLVGRTGVEFIDLQSGEAMRHHWVRGTCQYGVVPANGLLYAPPHSCACYIEAKLTGLVALAPGVRGQGSEVRGQGSEVRDQRSGVRDESFQPPALQQGPAYEEAQRPAASSAEQHKGLRRAQPSGTKAQSEGDWTTFRHDAARSGRASTDVSAEVKPAWQAQVGGRLSAPVIAEGRVLLASIDTHTVHVLDAVSGKPRWQYTAGGRIDSPPTVAEGLAVFGSADGWVYCLRASDGQLVWRCRVAPAERRLVAFGRLESAWPTQGSVLVHDGAVYCAAGRSSYLDGGIRLCRLDLKSGKKLAEHCVYSRDPKTGEQPEEPQSYEMPGALADVLVCDGALIYMRHMAFDPQDLTPRKAPAHLYSPAGLLNGDWGHRSYWIFGEHFYSGYIGWYFAGREAPAGRLLAIDDATIYGFGYKPEFYRGARKTQYHVFAIDRRAVAPQPATNYQRANRDYPQRAPGKFSVPLRWSQDTPQLAFAMVLAGEKLFLVGPPREALQSQEAYDGAQGAILCAVSARDGKILSEYPLDALPVFDGLAAAQGRLYLSLKDGRLMCLGPVKKISWTNMKSKEAQRPCFFIPSIF